MSDYAEHQHKEFIDKIMYKILTYSSLRSLSDDSKRLERLGTPVTEQTQREMLAEGTKLIEDIENSLYRRLDEAGESR